MEIKQLSNERKKLPVSGNKSRNGIFYLYVLL